MDTVIHSVMGMAILGVVGWAINLEARIRVQESIPESLEKLFEAKFEALGQRLGNIERILSMYFSGRE